MRGDGVPTGGSGEAFGTRRVRKGRAWVGSPAMEHEVFVPVPPTALRRALGDPTRVPDCVPGLRAEPGPEPRTAPGGDGIAVHGRLRLRAGSHTITYRGGLRLTARPDDSWALHISATEARGEGSVRARLSLTLAEAEGGTRVRFAGSGEVAGRLLDEAGPQAAESALHRLLNRFAANMGRAGDALVGEEAGETGAGGPGATGPGVAEPGVKAAGAGTGTGAAAETGAETGGEARAEAGREAGTEEESGTAFGEDAMTDGTDRTSGAGEQPEGEGTEGEAAAKRPEGPGEAVGAEGTGEVGDAGAAEAVDDAEPKDAAEPVDSADAAEDTDAAQVVKDEADAAHPAKDEADAARDTPAPTDASEPGDTPEPQGATEPGDTPEPGEDDLLGIVPDTPASVFDTEIPPSSLGREEGPLGPEEGEPPAEAAHARRTMIGRSAEEVDHAPPRGRYAPEAVGGPGSAANTLRWAAPVAALVVASAVVAGRALRRRH
ncbi:Carbon monoxide dehydrogenase subunit G [Streptomyces sp. LcepLS]|nr:Carbon monoxide dehydrogenase subunit G [Streptomyces sp. LcepLS]